MWPPILEVGSEASAREIADLYLERGGEIFPSLFTWSAREAATSLARARSYLYHRYDRAALVRLLDETFGERRFGEAKARLCIPSCDGRYGDVYIFKTPHHPDDKKINTRR